MSNIKEQKNNRKTQGGYIALISLLIVAAAGLTIGIAVSLRGIEELQISLSDNQAAKAKNLAETCIEEGLESLRNNWANYSDSLSIDQNSCIINAVVNGNNATLWATGTVEIYTQKIETQIDEDLNILSWSEN